MIAIMDYGMGNLKSVEKAFVHLGFNVVVTSDKKKVLEAEKAVLPGVGAFSDCLKGLVDSELYEATEKFIETGKYFLGICVGMQLLFEKSYEFGEHKGFGYFKGSIKRFPDTLLKKEMKIPHLGWNNIKINKYHKLFKDIKDDSFVYFVHSYYAQVVDETIATASYGLDFSAFVSKDNIMATQFHPEKSQITGLQILKNFGEL
jgi:glutamine amidotransferase